jgi:uncharacterized protein
MGRVIPIVLDEQVTRTRVIASPELIKQTRRWDLIPKDLRQKTPSSCAVACLSAISFVVGQFAHEDQILSTLGQNPKGLKKFIGVGITKSLILDYLVKLSVGHRIINNRKTDVDAFLNAGHAVLMLFEQYRSGYIDSGLVRNLRMRMGSESFHAVIVTERNSLGYRVFDPGWAKGGWQTISKLTLDNALKDSFTALIGLDSDDGIHKKQRDDGVLLVNRHSGRWEFLPDTGLDSLSYNDMDELKRYHDTFTTIPDAIAPYQFIINVTNRCSLACLYCYAESPAPKANAKDMSPETFREIWQFANRINPHRESNIILHGGEPMLVFDSLVDEMRQARAVNPNITFSLQTNALGLTPERIELIRELDISVGLSLDGPPEINDAQRGNYKGTMRGIELLREAGMKTPILIVLTRAVCDSIELIIDHFVENSLFNLAFSPMIPSGIGRIHSDLAPTGELYGITLVKAWRRLMHHRSQGVPLVIRELTRYILNLSSDIRPSMCGRTSCGAGRALWGIDIDGSVYACDMLVGHEEMRIGHISNIELKAMEIHLNEHQLFALDRVETVESCNSCRWEKVCSRGCAADNYLTDSVGGKSHFCDAFDHIHEELAIELATNEDAQSYLQEVAVNQLVKNGVLVKEKQ